MDEHPLYVGCDNLIEWQFMADASDHSGDPYITDATVTFVIKDSDGETLASGPMAYTAVDNIPGLYQGVAPSTTVLINGGLYTIEVTAVAGSINAFVTFERYAMKRGARC